MSEEKPGAKKDLEDAREHEEEARKRAGHEESISDDEDQPKPAGPMGGANLGGAS